MFGFIFPHNHSFCSLVLRMHAHLSIYLHLQTADWAVSGISMILKTSPHWREPTDSVFKGKMLHNPSKFTKFMYVRMWQIHPHHLLYPSNPAIHLQIHWLSTLPRVAPQTLSLGVFCVHRVLSNSYHFEFVSKNIRP